MSLHSYVKVFVHVVWTVKGREKVLSRDTRPVLERHLLEYAAKNGIKIETLCVQIDHVHGLIDLSSKQRLEDVMHLLKGESSHWINSSDLMAVKFSWQRGYGAFSVSLSDRVRVKTYIDGQDDHHRIRSFGEEYKTLLREHGFAVGSADESFSE